MLIILTTPGFPVPGSTGFCNVSEVYGRCVRGQLSSICVAVLPRFVGRFVGDRPLVGYSLLPGRRFDNAVCGTNTGRMSIRSVSDRAGDFGGAGFDPAQGLFIAQAERLAGLADIRLDVLSPFLRALLVIDGTVTKFLEAYTLEPIDVHRLHQTTASLTEADPWLDAPAGASMVHRFTVLVGRESDRLYAWAESRIILERLSRSMRAGLDVEREGLGKILLDSAAETRREGLWYGLETRHDLPPEVARRCDGRFVTRAYRVIANGLPLMTITERFPAGL